MAPSTPDVENRLDQLLLGVEVVVEAPGLHVGERRDVLERHRREAAALEGAAAAASRMRWRVRSDLVAGFSACAGVLRAAVPVA